jgi:hypothetical protein
MLAALARVLWCELMGNVFVQLVQFSRQEVARKILSNVLVVLYHPLLRVHVSALMAIGQCKTDVHAILQPTAIVQ